MQNNLENTNIPEQNQFNILTENYEGPIDLLLDLAKKQKVDLSEISILKLAEQYIEFIENFKELHLEIAADYLVMAAWLTYLKSRLLLPKVKDEENHTAEELEEAVKYQLKRLQAMQNISKILYARPQIGRDIFYGGSFEGINIKYNISYQGTLFDLISSYSKIILKSERESSLQILSSELISVDESINRLKKMFFSIKEWINFINLIPIIKKNKVIKKSSISSNFVAILELSKNGLVDIKQTDVFSDIYVKSKE